MKDEIILRRIISKVQVSSKINYVLLTSPYPESL